MLHVNMNNEKKFQNYSFIIDFWQRLVTFVLYINFIFCTYKTSSSGTKDYMKEQYYTFRNGLDTLILKKIA